MKADQNDTCALCWKKSDKLNVDHCHDTGLVRGLLCYSCNTGLGQLKDSPVFLKAALIYLESYVA